MLRDLNFLVFLLVSLVVAGLMQFYFLGTAPFMQEMGVSSKYVPGAMALAQVAQAAATVVLLGSLIAQFGYRPTLAVGVLAWLVLYGVYILGKPAALVVAVQPLHGVAYVLFIIAGQIYANELAPEKIRASVQVAGFCRHDGSRTVPFYIDRWRGHGLLLGEGPVSVVPDLERARADHGGRSRGCDCLVTHDWGLAGGACSRNAQR